MPVFGEWVNVEEEFLTFFCPSGDYKWKNKMGVEAVVVNVPNIGKGFPFGFAGFLQGLFKLFRSLIIWGYLEAKCILGNGRFLGGVDDGDFHGRISLVGRSACRGLIMRILRI